MENKTKRNSVSNDSNDEKYQTESRTDEHVIEAHTLFKFIARWTNQVNQESDSSKGGQHSPRFYFRGEENHSYKLQPSLFRKSTFDHLRLKYRTDDPLEIERLLLQRFKRYTAHIYHSHT